MSAAATPPERDGDGWGAAPQWYPPPAHPPVGPSGSPYAGAPAPPRRPAFAIVGGAMAVVLLLVVVAVVGWRRLQVPEVDSSQIGHNPLVDVGGSCGSLEPLTPSALPAGVDPVEMTYGFEIPPPTTPVNRGSHSRMANVDEMMGFIDTADPGGRRAQLERDGFTAASRAVVTVPRSGNATVMTLQFRDPAAALDYAKFHIQSLCASMGFMTIEPGLPNVVSFGLGTRDGTEGRAIIVAGAYEINLSGEYGAPSAQGSSQQWAREVDRALR